MLCEDIRTIAFSQITGEWGNVQQNEGAPEALQILRACWGTSSGRSAVVDCETSQIRLEERNQNISS